MMSDLVRFGVSIEADLLERFDAAITARSYQTRSEAIRDLIRGMLVEAEWGDRNAEIVATISLVYDHHKSDLMQRLAHVQHHHLDEIVSSTHIHLDSDNCLEVLIVRGKAVTVRRLARKFPNAATATEDVGTRRENRPRGVGLDLGPCPEIQYDPRSPFCGAHQGAALHEAKIVSKRREVDRCQPVVRKTAVS